VGFKSTAEQSKAHYAISILGNEALEPSVGTEATVQQQGCIGTWIGIIDVRGKLFGELGNSDHVLKGAASGRRRVKLLPEYQGGGKFRASPAVREKAKMRRGVGDADRFASLLQTSTEDRFRRTA
jgi:hypothetical protein